MMNYLVYLVAEVIDLADRKGLDRRAFAVFLRSIVAAPNKDGDYTEADESGRSIKIKIYRFLRPSFNVGCEMRGTKLTKNFPSSS